MMIRIAECNGSRRLICHKDPKDTKVRKEPSCTFVLFVPFDR